MRTLVSRKTIDHSGSSLVTAALVLVSFWMLQPTTLAQQTSATDGVPVTIPQSVKTVHEWLDELQLFEEFSELKFAWVRRGQAMDMGGISNSNSVYFYRIVRPETKDAEQVLESCSLELARSISEGKLAAGFFQNSKNQVSLPEAVYLFRRELIKRFENQDLRLNRLELNNATLRCCVLTWLTEKANRPRLTAQILASLKAVSPNFERQLRLATFKAKVEKQRMREFHAALSNPTIPWTNLADELTLFDELFPDSKYSKHSNYLASEIAELISIQKEHPRLQQAQLSELPEKKRISELVMQLQYQNGAMMSSFQSYADPLSVEGSPAAQLRDIGLPAVPALIDAIDDNRFTRVSTRLVDEFWRVLTVGECCLVILSDIAVGLDLTQHINLAPPSNAKPNLQKAKAAAQNWWTLINQVGEYKYLSQQLSRLDDDWEIFDVAESLLQKYPDKALALIQPLVNRSDFLAPFLIESIAEKKPQGYRPFIKNLSASSSFAHRVPANQALWKLGDKVARHRMLNEWKQAADDPAEMLQLRMRENNLVIDMITFLLREGDKEAYECLTETLPELDPYTAYLALANLPADKIVSAIQREGPSSTPNVDRPATVAFRELLRYGMGDNRIAEPHRQSQDPRQSRRLSDVTAENIWSVLEEKTKPSLPRFDYVPTKRELETARDKFNAKILERIP